MIKRAWRELSVATLADQCKEVLKQTDSNFLETLQFHIESFEEIQRKMTQQSKLDYQQYYICSRNSLTKLKKIQKSTVKTRKFLREPFQIYKYL